MKSIEKHGFSGSETPSEPRVRLVTLSNSLGIQPYYLRKAANELGIPLVPGIGGKFVDPSEVSYLIERATQIKSNMQIPWAHERTAPEGFIDRGEAAKELNLTPISFDRLANRNSLVRVKLAGKSYVNKSEIEKIKKAREAKKKKTTVSGK